MGRRNVFLGTVGLIVLVVGAELVYVFQNQQKLVADVLVRLVVKQTESSAEKDKTDQAIYGLSKLAEARLIGVDERYERIEIATKVNLPAMPENEALKQSYQKLLLNSDKGKLIDPESIELTMLLYRLGLEAYKAGEYGLVEPMWQLAAGLSPEWSYFSLELANFYLEKGDDIKSRKVLERCLLFDYPRNACRRYIDDSFLVNQARPVGSWEGSVNELD